MNFNIKYRWRSFRQHTRYNGGTGAVIFFQCQSARVTLWGTPPNSAVRRGVVPSRSQALSVPSGRRWSADLFSIGIKIIIERRALASIHKTTRVGGSPVAASPVRSWVVAGRPRLLLGRSRRYFHRVSGRRRTAAAALAPSDIMHHRPSRVQPPDARAQPSAPCQPGRCSPATTFITSNTFAGGDGAVMPAPACCCMRGGDIRRCSARSRTMSLDMGDIIEHFSSQHKQGTARPKSQVLSFCVNEAAHVDACPPSTFCTFPDQ